MKGLPPFGLLEGRLRLEDVDLADLAEGLAGRPAWVISGAAVLAGLARARARRRAVTVEVGAIGPPALLALLAQAGAWASVASGHELALAQKAGFHSRQLVVQAPVLDDGFILEALSARVGVLACRGPEERARLTRIARSLKLPVPKSSGAPPRVPASAFARCGGLLGRLLAGPPRLALDALWEPSRALPVVLPLVASSASAGRRATLEGLSSARRTAVRLLGEAARGDWVVIPDATALAVRPPHPAWPRPRSVLVAGGVWRELDPRPMPPSD